MQFFELEKPKQPKPTTKHKTKHKNKTTQPQRPVKIRKIKVKQPRPSQPLITSLPPCRNLPCHPCKASDVLHVYFCISSPGGSLISGKSRRRWYQYTFRFFFSCLFFGWAVWFLFLLFVCVGCCLVVGWETP